MYKYVDKQIGSLGQSMDREEEKAIHSIVSFSRAYPFHLKLRRDLSISAPLGQEHILSPNLFPQFCPIMYKAAPLTIFILDSGCSLFPLPVSWLELDQPFPAFPGMASFVGEPASKNQLPPSIDCSPPVGGTDGTSWL